MTKFRLKIILLFAFLILLDVSVWADVKLPALVGDNMVLQRDSRIKLWGWADPGEKVSAQFQNKQLTAEAGKDGRWTMVLSPLSAGGPYEMVIRGKNTITIKNILVGDVWLASGQSNMALMLKAINNSEQEIRTAENPEIRLLTVNNKTAFQPEQDIVTNGWEECSPALAEKFSAIAYLFGRELYKKYQVPIGLISSSWGGTIVEDWTSAEGLNSFEYLKESVKSISKISTADYKANKENREAWNAQYGSIDRGSAADGKTWADPDLSAADWSTLQFPGFWTTAKELKGFDGIVWFRKEINIPEEASGKPVELHMGDIVFSDSTYFNGKLAGATDGFFKARVYTVPAETVKTGRNVIAVRIKGAPSVGGGLMGTADNIYAQAGDSRIPLSGDWLYKTGPDISGFPPLLPGLENFNEAMPNTPTVLFNGMISPLTLFSIKGVIWYQGESNADTLEEAQQYYSLFPALINDWRKQWGYEFPFLFVQLAGYQPDKPEPADYPWARLRDAQYKALALPNTGMATAIDIGDEKDIHPKNKQDVAHRLVLAAEKVAYNENPVYSGPMFKTMKVEQNKVRLSFDNIGSGLWVKDRYGYIRGFAIAGADKRFVWARAFQEGDDIIVYAESIAQPAAVRYNWGNTPDGNLYNRENLPAVPFRTDDW
jgi:sialate O-acetylesterase